MSVRHAALGRSGSRFTRRAAILLVVITALLIAAFFPVRQLLAQRAHEQQLEQQVQVLERTNQALDRRIDRLHDPEYLERLARECLGMVMPGEVSFAVVPKGTNAKPVPC